MSKKSRNLFDEIPQAEEFPFAEYSGDRAILLLPNGSMFPAVIPEDVERPDKPGKALVLDGVVTKLK